MGVHSLTREDVSRINDVIIALIGDDRSTTLTLTNDANDLHRLVRLLVSIGPRKAKAVIDEIARSGAVREDAVKALADAVARAHSLAMSPPPQLVDAIIYIVRGMDAYGALAVRKSREEFYIWGAARQLIEQQHDLMDIADGVGATAVEIAAAIAAMLAEPVDSGGLFTVKVGNHHIKLMSLLTALRLAANQFWAFEPMAEEILDRVAEGVKDAFVSAVGSGSATVKRGPLWRRITVTTTLSDLLGMKVPNNPQVAVELTIAASGSDVVRADVTASGVWSAEGQSPQRWNLLTSHAIELHEGFDMRSVEGLVEELRRQVGQAVDAVLKGLRDVVIKVAVAEELYKMGYRFNKDEGAFESEDDGIVKKVSGDFMGQGGTFDLAADLILDAKKLFGVRRAAAAARLVRLLGERELAAMAGVAGLMRGASPEEEGIRIVNSGVRVDPSALSYEGAQELVARYLRLIDGEAQAVRDLLCRLVRGRGGAKDDMTELAMLVRIVLLYESSEGSPLLNGLIYNDLRKALDGLSSLARKGWAGFYLLGREVAELVRAANIRFEPDGTITINGKVVEDIIRNHTLRELPESAFRRMVSDAYLAIIKAVFSDVALYDSRIVDDIMKGSRITAKHIAKINHDDRYWLPLNVHILRYADDDAAATLMELVGWDEDALAVLTSYDASVKTRIDKLVDAALRRRNPSLSTELVLRYRKEVLSGAGVIESGGVRWIDAGRYLAQVVGLNDDGTYTFLVFPKSSGEVTYGIAYRARDLNEALKEADKTMDREQWFLSLLLRSKLPEDVVRVDTWSVEGNYHVARIVAKAGGAVMLEFYGPHARCVLLELLPSTKGRLERGPPAGGRTTEAADSVPA